MKTDYPKLPFRFDMTAHFNLLKKEGWVTFVSFGNSLAKCFLVSHIRQHTNYRHIYWAVSNEDRELVAPSITEFFHKNDVCIISGDLDLRGYYQFLKAQEGDRKIFLFENFDAHQKQTFPDSKTISENALSLKKNTKISWFAFCEELSRIGYESSSDQTLEPGQFIKRGESIFIFPYQSDKCYLAGLDDDNIDVLYSFDQTNKTQKDPVENIDIWPKEFDATPTALIEQSFHDNKDSLFIKDEREMAIEDFGIPTIELTSFPKNEKNFSHLNFFSVLPFYTVSDFVVELKERFHRDYQIIISTKKKEALENIFRENNISWTQDRNQLIPPSCVLLIEEEGFLSHGFQNNKQLLLYLTDREIFQFHRQSKSKKAVKGMNFEMINSLKPGDFVIHADHGVAKFDGIIRRELIEKNAREYLKLCYAGTDKLFVPVESAEKVSKFIGEDVPHLTKLGSSDWQKLQNKAKKEAKKIAKDLLEIYAKQEMAKGHAFVADDAMMQDFCDSFPYALTPGQAQSWEEVRQDMESDRIMDRLVCGDVGFGKTEIAMRAAFKAFRSGKQCVFLAPITILAEQHYQGFLKRIKDNYGIKVSLLSRFQDAKVQKKIAEDITLGLIDIVIGTHRILSEDVIFKNLGLIIIDEEQRFGVEQKEKLKKIRADVDILNLTATPIPRTLHMGLSKLKKISTITTPPPGRLPVITEVRRYNLNLIRERILYEIERGGQVYFLHNRVQTIDSQTQQLQQLMPELKFIVAHGQLSPSELERRILEFKEKKAHVLVSSTIIENGIDLPNANTLLVNNADRFGLSQLYQLRGRVGRGRTQAYAFFLYQGQKLEIESRKRLRAIVEASELGSGFQIAMKDLEIRGAGEILGANQSGSMKDIGVSYFLRMLERTIAEIKSGERSTDNIEIEQENISVEIPLSAYIPNNYIPSTDEKIRTYKDLAACETIEQLNEARKNIREDFGELPETVQNITQVVELKICLREARLEGVKVQKISHKLYETVLRMGKRFSPDQLFGIIQNSKYKWTITSNAIKLQMPTLPISWYRELEQEIKLLVPKKKKEVKKEK